MFSLIGSVPTACPYAAFPMRLLLYALTRKVWGIKAARHDFREIHAHLHSICKECICILKMPVDTTLH
jgi:hypothetical protein